MYQRLTFTFLFFVFIGKLWAQKITVSDPTTIKPESKYEVVGNVGDHTLSVITHIKGIDIVAFNEYMHIAWQKTIELEKRFPKVQSIVAPNPKHFYLSYTHRVKNNTFLKLHDIDHTGHVRDTVIIKDFGISLYSPQLVSYHSEDKTKLLFYEVDGGKIKTVLVYDTITKSVLWEDNFKNINLSQNAELHQIVIDNEGSVYLLLARDNYTSRDKTHHYEVFERHIGQKGLITYNINLGDLLTYDNLFEYDNLNQHLVGVGLYSEKNRGRAQGYYFVRIPKKNPANASIYTHAFEDVFVEEFMDKKGLKNTGIDDTDIMEILFRRDGGVLVVGERSRRNADYASPSGYMGGYRRGASDFFYNNLFVFSIHPTGENHWQKILHKKQYSFDDNGLYSSYFMMKTPTNIRLIFNDEIKDENTVSSYVIKGNGTIERNSLLNTQDQNLRLQFRNAQQMQSNAFVVPSESRSRLQLVKIEF